jgi:hypothetical protein
MLWDLERLVFEARMAWMTVSVEEVAWLMVPEVSVADWDKYSCCSH